MLFWDIWPELPPQRQDFVGLSMMTKWLYPIYQRLCLRAINVMTGRIKKKQILAEFSHLLDQQPELHICPLCDRAVPKSQRDEHHLIPKSHGGRQTAILHRICHQQIHALFTETELARQYNTVEKLKLQVGVMGFIEWVRLKPDDFFERTRKSRRLKST
jgi:hypothetical protein